MKRTTVIALVTGGTLGLVAAGVGIALSRQEGRETARKLLASTQAATKKASERVAKTATEQYHTLAPRAADALQAVREQAPQAVESLAGALPRLSPGRRRDATEVTA